MKLCVQHSLGHRSLSRPLHAHVLLWSRQAGVLEACVGGCQPGLRVRQPGLEHSNPVVELAMPLLQLLDCLLELAMPLLQFLGCLLELGVRVPAMGEGPAECANTFK